MEFLENVKKAKKIKTYSFVVSEQIVKIRFNRVVVARVTQNCSQNVCAMVETRLLFFLLSETIHDTSESSHYDLIYSAVLVVFSVLMSTAPPHRTNESGVYRVPGMGNTRIVHYSFIHTIRFINTIIYETLTRRTCSFITATRVDNTRYYITYSRKETESTNHMYTFRYTRYRFGLCFVNILGLDPHLFCIAHAITEIVQ